MYYLSYYHKTEVIKMKRTSCNFNKRIPLLTLVFDRKHTGGAKKAAPVELRVTYCGKQKYLSTGVRVLPSEWDKANCEVKRRADAGQLNTMLFNQKSELLEVVMELYKNGSLDLSKVGEVMKHKESGEAFLDFVEQRIGERNDVKPGTARRWRAWLSQMRKWGKIKGFSDVTEQNVYAMSDWCHERGLKQSTICGYHKNLKMFIGEAVRRGYLAENVYQKYGISIERGEPCTERFLTDNEVERLSEVKLPAESLERVRDMFLFQCLTGLSYSDMETWHKDWVETDGDGTTVYTNRRVKSVKPFVFVLLPKAVRLLAKYGGQPPVMSNAQYNLRLKVVAEAAGINKPVSSHCGRHTAAMVWLNHGIPLEVVSRCLGHSSTNITQKVYAHLESKTIKKAFENFRQSEWMK